MFSLGADLTMKPTDWLDVAPSPLVVVFVADPAVVSASFEGSTKI